MLDVESISFRLDEDMIEALFMNNSTPAVPPRDAGRKTTAPPFRQEERVLDPKKAQNIAILLRALNVTCEEVSDALLDGECSLGHCNADFVCLDKFSGQRFSLKVNLLL
jgi:hypothetical protein